MATSTTERPDRRMRRCYPSPAFRVRHSDKKCGCACTPVVPGINVCSTEDWNSMKGRRLVMRRKVIIILGAAVLATGALPARAQTFPSYGCADGTKFIVGFYPYDK